MKSTKILTTIHGTSAVRDCTGQLNLWQDTFSFIRRRKLTLRGAERMIRRDRPNFSAERVEYAIFAR